MGEPKEGVEYRIYKVWYAAGDDGTIWSCKTGKWVQMHSKHHTNLYHNYRNYQMVNAKIILEAFGFPKPTKGSLIKYKDGNKENIRLDNLSWRHGKHKIGKTGVLNSKQVRDIKERHRDGEHIESIQREYPVDKQEINMIVSGVKWKKVRMRKKKDE